MPPRKSRSRHRRRPSAPKGLRWVAFGLIGLALFAAGIYVGTRGAPGWLSFAHWRSSSPQRVQRGARSAAPRAPETRAPAIEVPAPSPALPGHGGRVALVIDDLGRSVHQVDELESLGVPLTYSVLPFESHTREVVEDLLRRRAEILCHLPMEPSGHANPGPGALTEAMSAAELRRATEAALAAVPGAVGVNNHMGSELTADPRAMRTILGVIGKDKLFFLDSRTSAASVGYRLARSMGIPAAERQVFIDPNMERAAIHKEFDRLLRLARENGAAIAIAHPHPITMEILRQEVPRAVAEGYEFVPVSYLLTRSTMPE